MIRHPPFFPFSNMKAIFTFLPVNNSAIGERHAWTLRSHVMKKAHTKNPGFKRKRKKKSYINSYSYKSFTVEVQAVSLLHAFIFIWLYKYAGVPLLIWQNY